MKEHGNTDTENLWLLLGIADLQKADCIQYVVHRVPGRYILKKPAYEDHELKKYAFIDILHTSFLLPDVKDNFFRNSAVTASCILHRQWTDCFQP